MMVLKWKELDWERKCAWLRKTTTSRRSTSDALFGTAQRGADNSPIRSRDSRNLQRPSCSCETSFNVGGKTRNIVFHLVLWPCFETSCLFLLLVLAYMSKQCIVSLNCCNLDLKLNVTAIKFPSEIITLCMTVEHLSYNTVQFRK